MARLVLLNGLPGSGKSTAARAVAAQRPLTLVLDVDVVRGLLGGWTGNPERAGLLARELATAMARTHLAAGHDVLVPQFLGRPDLLLTLERVAVERAAAFVEIALLVPPARAAERLRHRRATQERPEDVVSDVLLDPTEPGALDEMHRRLTAVLATRPATHLLDADRDAEAVRRDVVDLLRRPGEPIAHAVRPSR